MSFSFENRVRFSDVHFCSDFRHPDALSGPVLRVILIRPDEKTM